MVTSFKTQRVASTFPQRPGDIYYLSVAIHAVLGLIAEGLAIYAMLAGYKILPRKIGKLRYWMWATFGFWFAAMIMGVYTYYIWYIQPPAVVALPPVAAEIAETDEGAETVPAGELAAPPSQQVALLNFE